MEEGLQAATKPPITIFFSYAHKDEALRDMLASRLTGLKDEGLIDDWYDRQIVAGTEWAYAIHTHLQTASIILLLISPDFMASDYCMSIEVQQAMERYYYEDARVIPILLRPAEWHEAPFARLQCLPHGAKPVTMWDDPDQAFDDIISGLRQVIEELSTHLRPLLLLDPPPDTLTSSSLQRKETNDCFQSHRARQSRKALLNIVRNRWIMKYLRQALEDSLPIELILNEQPDAVLNPQLDIAANYQNLVLKELDQPPRQLATRTPLTQIYQDAAGQLLILGEPGSGKTILLLQLTRDLLKNAQEHEDQPIPVVFNLSSWTLNRPPIAEWLINELNFQYDVSPDLARCWVENNAVLPLLDGLDEVASQHRHACIEALNTYIQTFGPLPLVVSSRSAEYYAQSTRIRISTAIFIQPLNQDQIKSYLIQSQKQVTSLQEALNRDDVLRELASTPLMLNMMTLAFKGLSLNDVLSTGSPEAQRRRVFATYVQRKLDPEGGETGQTGRRLTWLAQRLKQHDQTQLFLERMQPDWLSIDRANKSYRIGVRLIGEVGSALSVWLLTILINALLNGWFAGLLAGISFGLLVGVSFTVLGAKGMLTAGPGGSLSKVLLFTLLSFLNPSGQGQVNWGALLPPGPPIEEIKPTEKLTWTWENVSQNSCAGLLIGLIIGLILGLSSLLFHNALGVFVNMLLLCLFIGLFIGLIVGLGEAVSGGVLQESDLVAPNYGIWQSAHNALRLGLTYGLSYGLIFGGLFFALFFFASDIGSAWKVGITVFLDVLLFTGPAIGLSNGGMACIKHFVLRIILKHRGIMPLKALPFLEHVEHLALLRKVGGGYFFFHRFLLDYFASLDGVPNTSV